MSRILFCHRKWNEAISRIYQEIAAKAWGNLRFRNDRNNKTSKVVLSSIPEECVMKGISKGLTCSALHRPERSRRE